MSNQNEVKDLLKSFSTLSFTTGSLYNYMRNNASVTEAIVLKQQLRGIQSLQETIVDSILSYAEDLPDELDLLEKLLDLQ